MKSFFHGSSFTANARERLRFLKGNLFRILIWPIAAAALVGIGWLFLLGNLSENKKMLEQEALQEAEDHSKAYAAHLARTIEALEQIALHLRFEWKMLQGRLHLEEMTDLGLFPKGSDVYAAIIDRNGKILTATIPDRSETKVADRWYFRVQEYGATKRLYIGEPMFGRVTKRPVIGLSHRIEDETGEFAGVVLLSVTPDYFVAYYDETIFGRDGFLAMVGTDSVIRASRSGDLVTPAEAPLLNTVPTFEVPTGHAIFEGDVWFTDKRTRYVGWQSLPQYPLVAIAGLGQQEVLGPYWERREEAIQAGIFATIGLFIFTLFAMLFSMRLARRDFQLRSSQEAYRMATESGHEGFYILRPILTESGPVKDFHIIDCNQYAAALFRHRKEELLGKTIASLYETADPKLLLQFLHQTMATGVCEDEWEITGNSPLNTKWISIKGVRADGNLALTVRDISETKEHVAELERQSNEDVLTGLPNRQWIQAHLPKAVEHAIAENAMLAVLFIDLDGFKAVNDTLGHEAGDEVLRMASRRLKEAIRPHDYVVRLGGDEFVVVLDIIPHKTDAAHVAERIQHAFEDEFRLPQSTQSIGASVGISLFPDDGTDAETLLRHADIAMYSAKTSGKRNYRFYDDKFHEALRIRCEKEAELRYAIQNDQFVMYYQPRIDMTSGVITSMEALVRWAHPTKGLISPFEFIPMAEETGLILPLGESVVEKVCSQLACWSSRGKDLLPVSINVSSRQFNQVDVAKLLSSAMARHKIAPELIEIEVTESSMMGDDENIRETIKSLQKLGIKMLVDDFGTGYSSLSQLQRMKFDVLKVDRAFTSQLDKNEQGKIFFKAIVTMAHALGMRVVAEGVENMEQAKVLKSLNCDEMQGFYFSEPLPPGGAQPTLPTWIFPRVT
jgi:diguanylate cyclase (GGDEF)-like protein